MIKILLNILLVYWLLNVKYDCSVASTGNGLSTDVITSTGRTVTNTGPLPKCEYNVLIQKRNITLPSSSTDCWSLLTWIKVFGMITHGDGSDIIGIHALPVYFNLQYDGDLKWELWLDTCPPCGYETRLDVYVDQQYDPALQCKTKPISMTSQQKDCESTKNLIQETTTVPGDARSVQKGATNAVDASSIQGSTTVTTITTPDECKLEANNDDFLSNPGKVATVAAASSFVAGAAAASTTVFLVLRFCLEVPIRIRHRQSKQQATDSNHQAIC